MATKTTIPRFLLPQYGAIWRITARRAPFPRPASAELGQVLVRYASKTVASSKTTATKTTSAASKTAAAKKVEAPKAASTKAAASKVTSVKAASTKVVPPKTAPVKAPTTKAPAAKAATPKTPTSQPASKVPITAAAKTAVPKVPIPPTPATPKTSTIPDPSKPIVLEKPEKFNPPSHGARLPRGTPKHYGGAPTFEEVQTQKKTEYPGLPPPENTWSHWFINNRHIHMFITLGTLVSLAAYTFTAKFNATSPYADMIPAISEFPSHPIDYISTCLHVLRLHEEHISAVTAEKRRRKVDDVAKRNEYRKAHGLDTAQGIESWAGFSNSPVASPAAPVDDGTAASSVEAQTRPDTQPDLGITEEGKRKKFLGIF
ncbi:hypothetical protein SCUP515_08383 [Seiridium cupressi]